MHPWDWDFPDNTARNTPDPGAALSFGKLRHEDYREILLLGRVIVNKNR
jgi:hypothetical protein